MNSTLLLYVCLSNPARSALIANSSSTYAPAKPEFVLRDTVTLRVRFYELSNSTGLLEQQDIGENATLSFGGKKTNAIVSSLAFLFFTNALTRNADEPTDIFWEGELDLNTEEFITAFGTDTTTALTCELEVSEDAERRTVAQFEATGIFDVIRGGEAAPTPAVPPMPSAPINDTLFGGVTGAWVQRTFPAVWQKFIDNVSLLFPWSRLSGVPATFPPSAHNHDASAITTGTIDVARLPALSLTATLSVANAAARLALTAAAAQGKIVVDADTGKSWGLVTGGNPATAGDWVQVGDREIDMDDVVGLPAALDAKAEDADFVIDDFFTSDSPSDFVGEVNAAFYNHASEIFARPTYGEVTDEIAAENMASGGRVALGTLSTAGNTNAAAVSSLNRRLLVEATIGVGAGAFTRTITLQTTNAQAGDEREIVIAMPASTNPTIEIRNATSGGTLLGTVPTDALVARSWTLWTRYNGASWNVCSLQPNSAKEYVSAYVDPIAAQRIGSDQAISDGVTPNRAQVQGPFVGGSRGWFAGAVSATWRGLVTVPTTNPAASAYLFLVNSVAGAETANSLISYIFPNGRLEINALGTGGFTNSRSFNYSGFRAAYSGQTGILEIAFTSGTTNPIVRWNDVDISVNFTAATAGTPPAWIDAALVSTYHVTAYNWPAGPAPIGCWINGTLTDAERASWRATGNAPYWVAAGGSQALAISSDFSAGVDSWGAAQGAVVGNVDAIGGIDNVLELNTGGGTGAAASRDLGLGNIVGRTIRLRFDVYRPSANTAGTHINIRDGGSGLLTPTLDFVPPADTWTSYDVVIPMANPTTALQFRLAIAATSGGTLGTGDKVYFKNVKVNLMGALSIPVAQGTYLDDATSIGGNLATLTGMFAPAQSGKITSTTLKGYVDPIVTQRLSADQIISDGLTTNRAQVQISGTRGNLAGASAVTWRGLVTVPSSNPAATLGLFAVQSSATSLGGVFSLCCFVGTTGALSIEQQTTPVNTHIVKVIYPAFRSTYSGQTGILEVYITPLAVVVRWNDVDISSAFSAANIGTPPPWLDTTLVSTYHLTGYNWPAGPAPIGCWILGALSADDRTYWRTTGKPPAWVVPGGSRSAAASALTGDSSTFTGGPGTWQQWSNGALVVSGGKANLTIGSAFLGMRAIIASAENTLTANRAYRVTYTISGLVGTATFRYNDNGAASPIRTIVADGTYSDDVLLTTFTSIGFGGSNGATFAVDDITALPLGALSLPGVQPIAVMDDWTGIGGNAARLVGMTPVTDIRFWRVSADTATNGNQQLLGGDVVDSTKDVIDLIEQTTTGTPTTTIGSASAGAQYKASGALSAGINPVTTVTRKLASNAIWIGSNTTDTVRTTITGHRAA
jgi:hypothetical protein